jgi:transcriptional regulator with XRE-family HTH domain
MEQTKLIEMRKAKGFSQQYIADKLCIDGSCYSKREKGLIRIPYDEWEKLAGILDVPLEEIYDSDEKLFIFKDNSKVNYQGTNNVYTVSDSLIELQQKYITKLEEEIKALKKLLEK